MEHNNSPQGGFSTRIIRRHFAKPDAHGAITLPIYKNAAFEFPDSESIAAAFQFRHELHTYTRISNPTVAGFEDKVKAASGAENVVALASGMAAIANTFMTIAYAGCNIVASPHLFGNTFAFFKSTLAEFGVEARFVNTDNLDEVAAAVDQNTCAFFCEILTNPHLEIANLPEIAKIMRAKHVPMVIDTTIIPWCGFEAKACGIDVEVVSTTKYISGGATTMGGVIVDHGTFDWQHNRKLAKAPQPKGMSQFMFKLKSEIARNMGACMPPDTAYLQALGMETLQLRYEKMSDTAYRLAQRLTHQKKIVKVSYPKLEASAYKALSDALFTGNPGAMLTISLESKEACYRLMDNLHVFRRATNLFDNKSLAIHPESTIYGTFSQEMKRVMGVEPELIRLSVGLEELEDLAADIEGALSKV
ncbi:MAG: PLP-dependent transferase [Prevotellaceae bacterium]|jgi:O-acetylhomoserine (thiol)-lyase|nr:PLP-dependent transferase [Prevotellaceae bacterium]